MSIKLYSFQIFDEIVKLEDVPTPREVILDNDFDFLVKNFQILKIPKEKSQAISEKLRNKRKLRDVLKEEEIEFPFNQEIINRIYNFSTKSIEIIDFLSIRILYMTIPWIIRINDQTKEDFVYPMLSSYIFVMRSSFANLGKKCYQKVFEAIFTIPEFYKFVLCVRELHQYLQIDPSIDLMCFTLGKTVNSGAKPTDPFFAQILESFSLIVHDNPELFIERGKELISMITQFIFDFDSPALSFFGKLIKFVNTSDMNEVINTIASEFIGKIDKINPIKIERIEKECYVETNSNELLSEFKEKVFCPDFNLRFLPSLPACSSYIALCGQECSDYVNYATLAFKENQKAAQFFVNCLCRIIQKNSDKETFFSEWFSALEFISRLKGNPLVTASRIIVHPNIFYEGDTVFNKSKDFEIINTLRGKSIDVLLETEYCASLESCLIETSKGPFIFAETCLRLIANNAKISQKISEPTSFVSLLMDISIVYQRQFFKSDYEGIIEARRASLTLLSFLLQDENIKVSFFTHLNSCRAFVSLLYEQNLVDFVIKIVHSYILNEPNERLKFISQVIIDTLNSSSSYFPSEQAVNLFVNVLTMLNDTCSFNSEMKKQVTDICPLLPTLFNTLQSNDACRKFISVSITFLAHMGTYYVIRDIELESILNGIEKVKNNSFLKSLRFNLLELLAGEYLSSETCSFQIKSYQIPSIFPYIYFDTPMFSQILDDFISLCEYSSHNIDALGSGGFDLVLLDYLEKAKQQNSLTQEVVQKMLDLFSLICITNSTTQSVLRFITLLSPSRDNIISNYQYQFLSTLNKIIEDSNEQQISYFPLNGNSVVSPNHLFPSITTGFTFSCWVYIEKNRADYRPMLFTLKTGNSKIGAFISNNNVVATLFTNDIQASTKVNYILPIHQWTFISLSYRAFTNRFTIVMTVNCNPCEPIVLPIIPLLTKVTYKIGGGSFNPVDMPHKMAAPILNEFTEPKDCAELQALGMNPKPSDAPRAFYIFPKINGSVELIPQFMHLLIDKSVIQSLFPLMMNLDLKKTDGTKVLQLEMSITILTNILSFSSIAQKNFVESRGFEIISHLIITQWKASFTMKMYAQLAKMMNAESEILQKSLFKNILTNFDIIALMEPEAQLRVLKSWPQTLFPSFQDLSSELFNYSRILLILRTYFFYSEKNNQQGIKREKETNVKQCREALTRILFEYAHQCFDLDFFAEVIANIVSSPEIEQSIDLLDFLHAVISSKFATFSFEDQQVQSLLFSLFKLKEQKVEVFGIRIISSLKVYDLPSSFFEKEIRLLISFYIPESDSKELFDACINEVKNMPEIFPFCCYIGQKIGAQAVHEILHVIKPSLIEKLSKSSLIWPMTLCSRLSQEEQRNMLLVMCKCKERWFEMFDLYDIVCGSYTDSSYASKQLFVEVIADLLISKQITSSKQVIDNFFAIAKKFIFFRPKNETNKCIAKLFLTYNEKISITKATERPELKTSLRFDENGFWVDAYAARRCVDVYLEFNSTKYLPFILVLCSYMQRLKDKSFVPDLAKMSLTEKERKEMAEYVDFFSYHTGVAKKNQFFLNGKIPQNPNFVNTFYETKITNDLQVQQQDIYSLIQDESNQTMNLMETILLFDIGDLQVATNEKCLMENRKIRETRNKNKTRWEKLWAALSDGGPWSSLALPGQKRRRSNVQSYGYVPVKLENKIFNSLSTVSQQNDEYILSFPCIYETIEEECAAHFELTKNDVIINIYNMSAVVIPINELRAAFLSTRNGKANGVQLITSTGEAISLKFQGINAAEITNTIYTLHPQRLEHIQLRGICELVEMESLDQRWISGGISTFEYICLLNRADGRSFDNPEHYPVFPLVTPELKNRDFSKVLKIPDAKKVVLCLSNIEPFKSRMKDEESKFIEYGEEFEATPEFYCFPEVFEGSFKLPERAKDANEFVYQNRKLLESDEVSAQIHNWLNAMWKFPNMHKQRSVKATKKRKIEFIIPTERLLSVFYDRGHFSFLQNNNTMLQFQVNLISCVDQPVVGSDPGNIFISKLDTQPVTMPRMIATVDLQRFAIVRTQAPFLQIIDSSNEKKDIVNSEYEVTCVASDESWICAGTSTSEIIAYYEEKERFVIQAFRDSIVQIAMKENLGMIVAATKSGSLIVCSLVNGAVTNSIKLGNVKPKKLLISNTSGFIICFCTEVTPVSENNFITVHSVNGSFIRKVPLNDQVRAWATFSSTKGVDYLVISSNKELKYSEVFYADEMTKIKDEEEQSVFVGYANETSSVLTVSQSGKVSSIPVNL